MANENGQVADPWAGAAGHLRTDDNIVAPMKNVEDKVAFVTGGDSGIGLGIARALVNAGMKVVITYRSAAHCDEAMKVLEAAGNRVHAIALDVCDRAAIVAAAEETVRVFGKVHLLVNNAGVAPMIALSNATFDDWDWCMGVNVTGVFNGVRAFLPHIKAHGEGGQIVSTSSMQAGLFVGLYWGVYSASKFAVVGMMEALRSELLNTNIGVSVFCPASVKSSIGNGDRNRPSALAETGAPDSDILPLIESFSIDLQSAIQSDGEWQMDPAEAGERVLQGIRRNDLYILCHPEYEQAIRDRYDALLASIPKGEPPPSKARVAVTQISQISVRQRAGRKVIASPSTRLT